MCSKAVRWQDSAAAIWLCHADPGCAFMRHQPAAAQIKAQARRDAAAARADAHHAAEAALEEAAREAEEAEAEAQAQVVAEEAAALEAERVAQQQLAQQRASTTAAQQQEAKLHEHRHGLAKLRDQRLPSSMLHTCSCMSAAAGPAMCCTCWSRHISMRHGACCLGSA